MISSKSVLDQLKLCEEKLMDLYPYLTPEIKIKQNWTIVLHVTYELLSF